jgi:hypothetical protein
VIPAAAELPRTTPTAFADVIGIRGAWATPCAGDTPLAAISTLGDTATVRLSAVPA